MWTLKRKKRDLFISLQRQLLPLIEKMFAVAIATANYYVNLKKNDLFTIATNCMNLKKEDILLVCSGNCHR